MRGEHGASTFHVGLALYVAFLRRLTGQDDIVVGIPSTERRTVDDEQMIGLFVNTQVLRTRIDGRAAIADFIAAVHAAAVEAQENQDLPFERQLWPRDEAKRFFRERGEPLKVQLIDEKTEGQSEVSCYTIKDKDTFVDFCVGPHVPSTGRLKAFKLLSTSNAYWKGDARNQPMQRVYGTAFLSEKELTEHLTRIEEAKKRDHRKIGRDQRLFMFHAWAPGATFWLPKGTVLYNTLGNYMRDVLIPAAVYSLA